MSTNLPRTIPELINWCNVHGPLWAANGTQIGLSSAQTTAFTTLITGFIKANNDSQTARAASKTATMTLKNAMDAIEATGGAYINVIKAFATVTHNPAVYTLADVSPDSPPGTVADPVAPSQFGAAINPNGSLTITWKVAQPAGVTGVQYSVLRRLSPDAAYTAVSTPSSKKSYTDMTLPFGVDMVQYIVQPTRNDVAGPQSTVFTVQFGSVMGGGGLSIKTIAATPNTETAPMKMAA